ncbi:hypothetical protein EDB82DRAFT_40091 [Fusarium venenatum]|uniref:uncharacterized protein n=1 Tax=Fusarium venenatum TaxID=56646 RepID=UPI001D93DFCC|nr:hypothetical protein EDB82DRAFT_40091 [Fusarium venenatum]
MLPTCLVWKGFVALCIMTGGYWPGCLSRLGVLLQLLSFSKFFMSLLKHHHEWITPLSADPSSLTFCLTHSYYTKLALYNLSSKRGQATVQIWQFLISLARSPQKGNLSLSKPQKPQILVSVQLSLTDKTSDASRNLGSSAIGLSLSLERWNPCSLIVRTYIYTSCIYSLFRPL